MALSLLGCAHGAATRPPPLAAGSCTGNPDFRIGAGVYDITGPAAELSMMGYAKIGQKTEGIHLREARAVLP